MVRPAPRPSLTRRKSVLAVSRLSRRRIFVPQGSTQKRNGRLETYLRAPPTKTFWWSSLCGYHDVVIEKADNEHGPLGCWQRKDDSTRQDDLVDATTGNAGRKAVESRVVRDSSGVLDLARGDDCTPVLEADSQHPLSFSDSNWGRRSHD